MRLLFFAKLYDNHAGGGEICLQTFLKLFTNEGHVCRLVTGGRKYTREISKGVDKLEIIRVQEEKLQSEIYKQISIFNPDFIGGQHNWGMRVMGELRNVNIPKIFFIKIIYPLEEKSEKHFFKLYPIDILIANSKYVQKKFENSLGFKPILSYPLVDLDKYKVKRNSRKYITMVNYSKEKGKEIFQNIAYLLPGENFLAIRGWMSLRSRKAQKEKNITIAGPFADMRQVYSRTKLLLCPSICAEIFPRVVLEAGINGIPAVASNVGGLSEAEEKAGVVTVDNYKDPKAWVREIKKFDKDEYYQKRSSQAIKRTQQFDYFREYRKILSVMEFILRERKKLTVKIRITSNYFLVRFLRFFYFKIKTFKIQKKGPKAAILSKPIWKYRLS